VKGTVHQTELCLLYEFKITSIFRFVDKEAGGNFWWTKGQVDRFDGQRCKWTVLVDTEAVGQFWWTMRQVASFVGQ